MSDVNVKSLMEKLPEYFKPEKAKGVNGVIQFMFTGEQAGSWVLTVEDQTCTVDEGKADNPDLTIKGDAQDGINVLTGKLDGTRAYMLGKIKVFGDLSLAMKLMNFFEVE
jgi:putative sterol carrier protein